MDSSYLFNKHRELLSSKTGVRVDTIEEKGSIFVTLTSTAEKSLPVHLNLYKLQNGKSYYEITIEGVDCADWSTLEIKDEKGFEMCLSVAQEALAGNVVFQRSPILKKREGCFRYKDGWMCIPESQWFSTRTFRKKVKS